MSSIRRNLIGSLYLAGATLLSQLALVPVFLHFWGAQGYGSWLVLFTVPALFVFSDVGLSSAVGNALTLALGQGRVGEASGSFNAAWKFQIVAWTGVFCVLSAMLVFLPLQQWLGVGQLPLNEFTVTILLLSLYSLGSQQAGMVAAIYRAAGAYSRYLTWTAHARLLESALVAFVLAGGGRFIAVAATMLTVRTLGTAVLYRSGCQLLPNLRCRLFSGKWADLVSLLPSGLAFLSFPVANALINQGTLVVLNHLVGPSSVVLLNVSRQLARLFQQGTSIIQTAFQPEMTRAYAAADGARMRRLQAAALLLPLLAALPFVLGVTILGDGIIQWWTRNDLGVTWALMLVCAAEAVAYGCGGLCSLLPWAINRVRGLSLFYVLANAGALMAGALLVRPFGLVGLLGASFVAGAAYCAAGLLLGCRLGGFTLRELWAPREVLAICAWWRSKSAVPVPVPHASTPRL